MPAILWAFFVLGLCSFPGNKIPNFDLLNKISFDKIVHLFMFGIQSALLVYAFQEAPQKPTVILIILDVAFFGVLLECMQTNFFINRFGEWVDILANSLGAALGAMVYLKYDKRLR